MVSRGRIYSSYQLLLLLYNGFAMQDTAKSLIEDDTYYTMSLLMKGASHGYAPRSLVCCICSSLLAKNSLDSSIQVYSCGHATHLHCQLEGNRASFSGTLVGCPICTPGSKARKSSGMHKLAENGLVSSSPSSMKQPRSTPLLHLHDPEFGDNSFGSHPSRVCYHLRIFLCYILY